MCGYLRSVANMGVFINESISAIGHLLRRLVMTFLLTQRAVSRVSWSIISVACQREKEAVCEDQRDGRRVGVQLAGQYGVETLQDTKGNYLALCRTS
jgi:hypothetical protein